MKNSYWSRHHLGRAKEIQNVFCCVLPEFQKLGNSYTVLEKLRAKFATGYMLPSVGCGSDEFGAASSAGDVVLAESYLRLTPNPASLHPCYHKYRLSLRRTRQSTNNNNNYYYNGCLDNNRNLITTAVEVLDVRRTV